MRQPADFRSVCSLLALALAASCDSAPPSGPVVFGLYLQSSGGGRVVSSPVGIDCRENCLSSSAIYPAGTQVRLVAEPGATHRFLGWVGQCTGTGECLLSMTSDQHVFARFEEIDAGAPDGGLPADGGTSDGGTSDGGTGPPDGGPPADGGADPLTFPEEVTTVLRGVLIGSLAAPRLGVSAGYYRVKAFTNGVERAVVFEIERLHGACEDPQRSFLPRRDERWVFWSYDFQREDGEAYEALVRDALGNQLLFEVAFSTDCDDANAVVNFDTVGLSVQDLDGRFRTCEWATEPPFDDPAERCR